MKIQMKGLDNAISKLNELQRRAENLDGTHNVPISELLDQSFMIQNTKFESFEELVKESGFDVESQEDFAAIPDDEWDSFIARVTMFADWKTMLQAAGQKWVKQELGF